MKHILVYSCLFKVNHPTWHHFRVHVKTPQLLQIEQKWQLLLHTGTFIPAAICYHILSEKKMCFLNGRCFMFHSKKARSCCFPLAGPGEPCSQQQCCACKRSYLRLGTGSWGIVCIKYRLPNQLDVFLFTQIIPQQLQNQKMGITQEQIMQVRFLFCDNHSSQELCKSLFSSVWWGEVSSSSSIVLLVYFKKTVSLHTLAFARN